LPGQSEVHGGELAFSKGHAASRSTTSARRLQRGLTLRDYVLSGAADLVAIERGAASAGGGDVERRSHRAEHCGRYSEAQATARARRRLRVAANESAPFARGLGFHEEDLDRLLDTFSGGELTRASLARALGGDPDLLLLDEPTNHLDVASLEWLENELSSLDAGIILVAHDRWFLEATTTAVLELEAGRSDVLRRPVAPVALEKAARCRRRRRRRRATRRTSRARALRRRASATRRRRRSRPRRS
jgi:ATP-binding cassette subfamily F protein 3